MLFFYSREEVLVEASAGKIYGQKKQLGDREAKKKRKESILEDFKQACHNSAKGLTLSVSPR